MSPLLSELKINESAIVKSFRQTQKHDASHDIARRLMELGLLVGTPIKLVHEGPFGSPIAIEVRGTVISLRREEASFIEIEEA